MENTSLSVFIDIVVGLFREVTGESVQMGVPYIKRGESPGYGYTGIIGVSGARKGGLYFTSPAEMLRELAEIMLGQADCDDASLMDLVGELSNMIAGNARQSFGASFMISVPVVLRGSFDDIAIKLNPPVFIIPISWREHRCNLGIGIEEEQA
jgi:chemotaxis protein CheX